MLHFFCQVSSFQICMSICNKYSENTPHIDCNNYFCSYGGQTTPWELPYMTVLYQIVTIQYVKHVRKTVVILGMKSIWFFVMTLDNVIWSGYHTATRQLELWEANLTQVVTFLFFFPFFIFYSFIFLWDSCNVKTCNKDYWIKLNFL